MNAVRLREGSLYGHAVPYVLKLNLDWMDVCCDAAGDSIKGLASPLLEGDTQTSRNRSVEEALVST